MLDANRAGTPEQFRKAAEYLATINLAATDHWAYELKTLPRPKGRDTRAIVTQYDMGRPTTEPHDVLVDKEGYVWYTDFGEMFIGKFDPKTLKLVEYPIRKFKDKAPTGLLSIEFDHEGKIWFDTMYQGSLGCLDPKTGKIDYYPVAKEWNDDTVQLNFSGLRHDVDGKVWTKTVGTQHIFRVDIKTGQWERFHPAHLPHEGGEVHGIRIAAPHLSVPGQFRQERRNLGVDDAHRPGRAPRSQNGNSSAVPDAVRHQHAHGVRRQLDDADDVLGRQQPRPPDREGGAARLSRGTVAGRSSGQRFRARKTRLRR